MHGLIGKSKMAPHMADVIISPVGKHYDKGVQDVLPVQCHSATRPPTTLQYDVGASQECSTRSRSDSRIKAPLHALLTNTEAFFAFFFLST